MHVNHLLPLVCNKYEIYVLWVPGKTKENLSVNLQFTHNKEGVFNSLQLFSSFFHNKTFLTPP